MTIIATKHNNFVTIIEFKSDKSYFISETQEKFFAYFRKTFYESLIQIAAICCKLKNFNVSIVI